MTLLAAFRKIYMLRVQTEISWSHSTIRGSVHAGTSQQGDGSTTRLIQLTASPFFLRIVRSKNVRLTFVWPSHDFISLYLTILSQFTKIA